METEIERLKYRDRERKIRQRKKNTEIERERKQERGRERVYFALCTHESGKHASETIKNFSRSQQQWIWRIAFIQRLGANM